MNRTARSITRTALNRSCTLQGSLSSANMEFCEEVTAAAPTNLNNLYLTRCCCINCVNSIWIGDEKSAMNPFAALKGDPVYAVEVVREESPDEGGIKARI